MAVPTNLYQKDSLKGNREDLIEKIFQTSPTETPISSAAGRVTATSTFHEFQRDSLSAANKDNAQIDGDDIALQAQVATERVGNHLQIFAKVIGTSRRANIIKKAGRGSEQSYLRAKAMLELKRDIEAMVVSNNPAVASTTSVAGKSAGLGVQLYKNLSSAVGGSTTAWTSGAPTVAPVLGTPRALIVGYLNTVQQSVFANSSAQPDMIVMGPAHKAVFSGFTGIAQNRLDVNRKSQGAVVTGADIFVGDFGGAVQVVPHYLMTGATDVYLLNMDYIDMAFLDGIKTSPLAKTGDSEKELITADCCLAVRSSDAQGKISGLSGG
jgi:Family of unknown function (DUF5309)